MEDALTAQVHAGPDQTPVVAARCTEYEFEAVQAALRQALAPLGGMAAFVRPGERIVLKPNLLLGVAPELAITTHPAVVAAVAVEVREAGAHPVVVESPGAGIVHVKTVIERIYRKTGLREAAERYGFELSLDMEWGPVSVPDARLMRRLEVMNPIREAVGVINLAKFKTHAFMTFTGATKNMFGVIPGLNKVAFHGKFPDPLRFADMLLDVAGFVRPRLSIVDAIVGLEGKGPGTGGKARPLGFLLAGTDTVAMDVACCRIARIDTGAVPVLVAARERGLWSGRAADIDTVGVPVADLLVTDFLLPARHTRERGDSPVGFVEHLARPILRGGFSPRPRPKKGRCTLCKSCEQICPGKAIRMDIPGRVAKVDDALCIRCYCCHEVCPSAAIDLEFTGLGRAVHRLGLV
jgi:uncharacterized protein (DUF362 family)/Pyruvate/2-oxoacid:ferredoxin oxidoreductase delta subunit